VLPDWPLAAPKTKHVAQRLREFGVEDALILVESHDDPLFLAARNLPNVDVMTATGVDPVSMIAFAHLIVTEAALRRLEERLA
jgi:large subunit ribosomal protein L4